jgi:hypothetical protein
VQQALVVVVHPVVVMGEAASMVEGLERVVVHLVMVRGEAAALVEG